MKLSKTETLPLKSVDELFARKATDRMVKKIGEMQLKLYAESKRSLLVIFQGMDSAGKDGAIRNVFSEVNPMGCHVICFKKPTEHEYSHDFLWRIHNQVPPQGMIHIFNRSHYEDILVPAVEGYIDSDIISKRYKQINHFENMLEENGTTIVKFLLHISFNEQEKRLRERMTNPKKFWKHRDYDWETRKQWDQYLETYDSIIEKCDTIPWHIIPSDKNWYKEYLVAEKVHEALNKIDPKYPPLVSSIR
jgi:PPK2 family polyphosphate:nucleotide phosphotransferase